jgi:hypothetical protein
MWNKRGGLNNDINIKTFNAIGNGSSSDVASIQSAINAATKGSNYFNRNITIPSGNYVIDSNLTIPSSVSLKIQQGANFSIKSGSTLTVNGFTMSRGINGPSSNFPAKHDLFINNHVYSNNRYGISFSIEGQTTATDVGAIIEGNHIAYNAQDGIYSTVPSNKVKIVNNFIYKNGQDGIRFIGGASDMEVVGNHVYDNGQSGNSSYQTGILIGTGVVSGNAASNIRLARNRVFDDQGTKTQIIGIAIKGSNASISNVQIENNDITGTTTPTLFTGTLSNIKVRNNDGYNPIGVSSITVGASPFTYTAGYSPETIYVDGGTVSSITKGGITIATSTGRAIQLEPNESIVVTYSATPTMTADKH